MNPQRPSQYDLLRSLYYLRRISQFFADYFWFIIKNVIGWILILASLPVGLSVPGPGGIPLFLIGFAMVTLPGKRQLTARVLRGRPMQLNARLFAWIITIGSLLLPALAFLFLSYNPAVATFLLRRHGLMLAALILSAIAVSWMILQMGLRALNWLLRRAPVVRRKIRPWLRRHGIRLLPPRRKRRHEHDLSMEPMPLNDEILEIHERHHHRVRRIWAFSKQGFRWGFATAVTVFIFIVIVRPMVSQWPRIQLRILDVDPARFFLAAGMFSLFLFLFRAMSWRRLLIEFGHSLPIAASARVWSFSELARYLPGLIWQIISRVVLLRPYAVSAAVGATTQLIELILFLLANFLIAASCFAWFAAKSSQAARPWLYTSLIMVPLMAMLLHPRVLYAIISRAMVWLQQPPPARRVSGGKLVMLLSWMILGLLWQSLALWILAGNALGLDFRQWWVIAGSYSLAWCAGFLAIWVPGGLGVRELVFVAAMLFMLPSSIREQFANRDAFLGFLGFLSILLRLWTTCGKLALAGIAYATDYSSHLLRLAGPAAGRTSSSSPSSPDPRHRREIQRQEHGNP